MKNYTIGYYIYIFHCCAKIRVKYFHRAELTEGWQDRSNMSKYWRAVQSILVNFAFDNHNRSILELNCQNNVTSKLEVIPLTHTT